MRPDRVLLALAASLFAAGIGVWIFGGAAALRSVGLWLWVAAAGVLALPLLLLLIDTIIQAVRR